MIYRRPAEMAADALIGKYVVIGGQDPAIFPEPMVVLPPNPGLTYDPRRPSVRLSYIDPNGEPRYNGADARFPQGYSPSLHAVVLVLDGFDDVEAYRAQVAAYHARSRALEAMRARNGALAWDDILTGSAPDTGVTRLAVAPDASAPDGEPGGPRR